MDQNDLIINGLYNAIHEFLIKRNFHSTVDAFQEEIIHQAHKPPKTNYDNNLVDAFDEGKRELFFLTWKKYVPMGLRMNDEVTIKLEFFLHIYFAVFPMHPILKNRIPNQSAIIVKREQNIFKDYLNTQGNELTKMNELLPYFAQSCVKDPSTHPTFNKIFSQDWVIELRNQLINFINAMYSLNSQPFLVHMYQTYMDIQSKDSNQVLKDENNTSNQNINQNDNTINNNSNHMYNDNMSENNFNNKADTTTIHSKKGMEKQDMVQYVEELETNNKELVDILQDYHNKYKDLETAHSNLKNAHESSQTIQQKWATFSKEIQDLSEELFKISFTNDNTDKQASPKNKYSQKIKEFRDFLSLNMADQRMGADKENQKFNVNNSIDKHPVKLFSQNYEKLKGFMCSTDTESEEICSTIQQALRKRQTKYDQRTRTQVIYAFIQADVLDIKCPRDKSAIYEILFTYKKRDIRLSISRLANIFANDYIGRCYLAENDKFIELLINILKSEGGESSIRRNILGILQKISLRKNPQTTMINNELIETILQILNNEASTLNNYSQEYFTALLMNLSLRNDGKNACENASCDIIKIQFNLLSHESLQVKTFVNGTLYSILTKNSMKQKAKAIDLESKLLEQKASQDERFQQQIDYIIEQMNSETEQRDENDNSFTEENDYDNFGDEEGFVEEQSVDEDDTNDIGEEFLKENFLASADQEQIQQNYKPNYSNEQKDKTQMVNRSINYKPMNRPTTPSMIISNRISPSNQQRIRNAEGVRQKIMEGGQRPSNPNQPNQMNNQRGQNNNDTADLRNQDPTKGIGFDGNTDILGINSDGYVRGNNNKNDMGQNVFDKGDPKEPFFVYDKEDEENLDTNQLKSNNRYESTGSEKAIPTEMKHRPRLQRTPPEVAKYKDYVNNSKDFNLSNNNVQYSNDYQYGNSSIMPEEKIQKLEAEAKDPNWQEGFKSRPRLNRTPQYSLGGFVSTNNKNKLS